MAESVSRFAALKQKPIEAAAEGEIPQPRRSTAKAPAAPQTTRQTIGKHRDPDYERLNVYVRKETRKAAGRKWEDEGHRDLSDLVEKLLSKYIGT
jgi:hypothetical protein